MKICQWFKNNKSTLLNIPFIFNVRRSRFFNFPRFLRIVSFLFEFGNKKALQKYEVLFYFWYTRL